LRFLARAWDLVLDEVTDLADVLPVRDPGGVLFMFGRTPIESAVAVRAFYPGAQLDLRHDPPPRRWWFDRIVSLVPPQGEPAPIAGFVAVSAATAAALHGVNMTIMTANGVVLGTRVAAEPVIAPDTGIPLATVAGDPHRALKAGRVVWAGTLDVPREGTYGLELSASADATVWIDRKPTLSTQQPAAQLELAQGLHGFAVTATFGDAPPTFALRWQPPGARWSAIPPAAWFRLNRVDGLLAELRGAQRTVRRITPFPYYFFFPATLPGIYDVHWRGRLHVPSPGPVRLLPLTGSPLAIRIDDQPWNDEMRLQPGLHRFEVSASGVSGPARMRFYWEGPALDRALIPPHAFTPDSKG
jgi:hypothetical protein